MKYDNLLLEVRDRLAIVSINRPDKLNALNKKTLEELEMAIEEAVSREEIGAIILTGSGPKAFVAGADINELSEQAPLSGKEYSALGQRVLSTIESSAKVVIAAINGYALGGGCELALACHMRVAAESAKLGLPEVTLGIIPGFGGTQRLARIVGKGRALELILSGDMIDANEAFRIGLVNRVTPQGGALASAEALARTVISRGPVAVRTSIEAVSRGLEMPIQEGFALEAALFGLVVTTEDFKEGTRAFVEKRKPEFRGR